MDAGVASVRALVRDHLSTLAPCTVVANADVYNAVCGRRTGTAAHTVREALQALAVGSARPDTRRAKVACAVAVRLPELDASRRAQAYLAVPEIRRDYIGDQALAATRRAQDAAARLLGAAVADFWLKKTQLQCMSLAQSSAREVRKRDGNRCKLCSYVRARGATAVGGGPLDEQLRVAHLVARRDTFWRILGAALAEHETTPGWIFSEEGTKAVKKRLEEDPLHSAVHYMVVLCRFHDNVVQRVLYPKQAEPATSAGPEGGCT